MSIAHPAKFSEAVAKALPASQNFDFQRGCAPSRVPRVVGKERRVVDVDEPNKLGPAGNGV